MCTQALYLQRKDNVRCELLSINLYRKIPQGVGHTFEFTFESTTIMECQSFKKKYITDLKKNLFDVKFAYQ